MAVVVLPANGDSIEVVAAAAVRAIIYNTSGKTVELLNHATSAAGGILLKPGDTLDLGKVSAWTLAWQGRTLGGTAASIRVASE